MGWLNKKKEVKSEEKDFGKLPELPKLPELSRIDVENGPVNTDSPSQLPSYPSDSFGEKFSQNAIKDAIKGEKGDEEENEAYDADESQEFENDEEEMMPKLRDFKKERVAPSDAGQGPVFVRLDKFEDALHKFNKSKRKISEIENLIADLKEVNEKELRGLVSWEKEIKMIKRNFEQIDRDIFSKI